MLFVTNKMLFVINEHSFGFQAIFPGKWRF
jgi:hypothetical protein